ncbi:FAD-binding oxidoreductase [Roseisalinus antarcticus]|uniref:Putative FAD-linked oxidoreductase n=1 Tax=Roseisalinus antarcticus TaxID=254357 RepID=A0A1Y5TS22_9RHOB|nr:FAD-binding oxidoreductase [Roseisalinus antarcticus]SLN68302.1 putative FAD-linked oxidoreductase [Roseisalinus antarcticus]
MTARADPLLDALSGLPPGALRLGADVGAGHARDMSMTPGVLLRPGSTAEVALMLAACNDLRRPVVVQGGRTGLAGGASPREGEVALSLERMRDLTEADPLTSTIIAEAGVTLQRVQEAASAGGLRLAIDIGSRGSATIGGVIACNAGGIRVISHGMMRQHVLGLEAVLADGTILSRLGTLVKDNTGTDLKHLFIGTEGTLGVVTRAVLALSPEPADLAMAYCALGRLVDARGVLQSLQARFGRRLSAFEFIEARVHAAACAFGAVSPVPEGQGPTP